MTQDESTHHHDQPESRTSTAPVKRSINVRIPSRIRPGIGQQLGGKENQILQNENSQTFKQAASISEQIFKSDKKPFVYIRDLSLTLDLEKADQKNKQVTLHIPHRKQLYEISFDYEEMIVDNTSPSKAIGSVTERLWKEVTLDYQKLPQYYLKLSKARLTGKNSI